MLHFVLMFQNYCFPLGALVFETTLQASVEREQRLPSHLKALRSVILTIVRRSFGVF
jgi:hypothetical protein